MPIRLQANNGNIDLKVPIKQIVGAVDSVNGMTGDVVLDIPSKTSQLENDSDFATSAAVSNTEERINYKLGSYALKNEIPTVPTNVSTFTNDSGYLTIATLPKYDGGVE